MLGLWALRRGLRLRRTQLHGAVAQVLLRGRCLLALTDLGDDVVLDLQVFSRPYGDLLREIWREVPVTWAAGRPVAQELPVRHHCSPQAGAASIDR